MKYFLFLAFAFASTVPVIAQSPWVDCAEEAKKSNVATEKKQIDYAEIIRREQILKTCLSEKPLPNFSATSLEGKTITPQDVKDKVVLVNFWFIGCAPCIKEIPMFNELNEEYKDRGFVILSFARDNQSSLKDFTKKTPLNFNVFPSAGNLIEKTFGVVNGYPTNLLLNKKGMMVEYSTGGAIDDVGIARTKEKMRQLIEKELASK